MTRPLFAAVAAVIVVMTALAVVRWNNWTYGADAGLFAQATLNTFHGFANHPEHGTHFRYHWSPILAVLWPFVALTRTTLALQIAQVFLIALAAVPLAAIVRAYASDAWALRAGVLALLYPPLLSASFEEFHELAFYPALALALFWAADRARWAWFIVFAVAAELIREDVCAILIAIGATLAIAGILTRDSARQTGLLDGAPLQAKHLAIAGTALALLSAAILSVYALAIVPRLGGWVPSHFFYRYAFADGPLQTLLAIFTHPRDLAAQMLTLGRLTYLLEAFAPLAFLPLVTRWTWLAAPGFAVVLLSSNDLARHMGFHYELLWVPWMLLAAAWALVQIARFKTDAFARRWWTGAISVCIAVLALFNPMHPAHYLARQPYQQTASVVRAIACLPRGAPFATHDEWFAHLAASYPQSTDMRDNVGTFNGYVVYATDWKNPYVERELMPQIRAARSVGRFTLACRYGDVEVLRPNRTAGLRGHRCRSRRCAA